MNTTSLEISKKLYEVSGWADTEFWLDQVFDDEKILVPVAVKPDKDTKYYDAPAYDLGYLLRKLPHFSMIKYPDDPYYYLVQYLVKSKSPEDAAALLAIKLFEEGVLK